MALRHNRSTLLIGLALMALLAAAMLWHRTALAHDYAAAGITDVRALNRSPLGESGSGSRAVSLRLQDIQDHNLASFTIFRWAMGSLPVLTDTVLGVTTLTREFDRRTQVFALSQSVGLGRWWATKVVVGVLPLAAGFAALGFLFRSTADTWGVDEWKALDAAQLVSFGWMPAAIFVLSFCAGIAVAGFIRSSIPALLVAIVLSVGMFGALLTQYTALLPVQRALGPVFTEPWTGPPGALFLKSGVQDAAGRDVIPRYDCPEVTSATAADPDLPNEQIRLLEERCLRDQGVTASYTEFVPVTTLPRLTTILLALAAALSAMFLALDFTPLRRRVT